MGSGANTHALIAARLGYNGEYHEPTSAWQALGNGHRIYSPLLMRFHSPDTLSPFDKGGLNAYGYCGDDPVNNHDPNGRFHFKVMALGLVFTGLTGVSAAARGLFPPDSTEAKIFSIAGIVTGIAAAGVGAYYIKVKFFPRQGVTSVPTPVPTAPPLTPPARSPSFNLSRQTTVTDASLTQSTSSIVPARPMPATTTGQGGGPTQAELQRQRRAGFDHTASQATAPLVAPNKSIRKLSLVTAGPYRKPLGRGGGKARKVGKPDNGRRRSLKPYYGGAF
ncbi:RHS repeat-associated core domain-containing protein [Stenotrophomonas oahuensis]|uniref:RHS repeat-associated core domain-containing protein n=1 Tax=Stenotrophomonas oahuensis TaxID=3003271 RepID=A0ABY9YQF2_9GAMM|nr:RHS repeat-associated core domain-containing protein [Stenotrophomonas sp. A5586]WNH52846.1 RHS repeat-associated core domain-containing protein [Stenotrophomonas sp. A5586]